MKYMSEYRDPELAQNLVKRIRKEADGMAQVKLMEVCGTHTMAISRYGIRKLLPENIRLISGPGCPVCVTSNAYLDKAIALSKIENVMIATFGDMIRVPGSSSSLEQARARGADIRVVYSTMDALALAAKNSDKKIIFLGIGFETTAPTIAASIRTAHSRGLTNYFVLCAHKTMPKPMELLAKSEDILLTGFICPAHVSTIIGAEPYERIAHTYNKACVVAGFEPLDILESVLMLLRQIKSKDMKVEIQYSRVATARGNLTAQQLMKEVFTVCDAEWRGIGVIAESGLRISDQYAAFDADIVFSVPVEPTVEAKGCICGLIMQGLQEPKACALFGSVCTPDNPVGACMVSTEGTCAAWYKYERDSK
jgi:hydrogenase expression/formation protein HypD